MSAPSAATMPIAPPPRVPPRPSTAPPSDATRRQESQTDWPARATLVSHLRAHNLLLQKAISHIDDAVLHLMAARSGIPSSQIQQVRGEARNRKDLLDRVDKAIKMAQESEDRREGGGTRTGTESGCILETGPLFGSASAASSSVSHSPPSDDFSEVPQLRRSSSQPFLSQAPTKIYTFPELIERRRALQESIESWRSFAVEAQQHLAAQPQPPPNAVTSRASAAFAAQSQEPSSWAARCHRAQFEIRRREDLLLRLNQAIAQASVAHTTPEQFATLASYIPPALDKARFDAAYAHFCQGKSVRTNTPIIMPDVMKPVIDVYSLHVAVMREGSYVRVSARKSWDVVGARLGFIQTAATATEPARSSAEIAVYLEKVYRDRLQQFDHLYVSSVIDAVRKRMAEQQKKP